MQVSEGLSSHTIVPDLTRNPKSNPISNPKSNPTSNPKSSPRSCFDLYPNLDQKVICFTGGSLSSLLPVFTQTMTER